MGEETNENADTALKEENYIIPTVGRMVYYKSLGSACGKFPPKDRSANITDVREVIVDEHGHIHVLGEMEQNVKGKCIHQVRLAVFNPDGLFFSGWLSNGNQPGDWDWMPYQKGQAKKTEEVEKELETGTSQKED